MVSQYIGQYNEFKLDPSLTSAKSDSNYKQSMKRKNAKLKKSSLGLRVNKHESSVAANHSRSSSQQSEASQNQSSFESI